MTEPSYLSTLINPNDTLERQNQKLRVVVEKLMRRVEQTTNQDTQGYLHFERAIALENEVQRRTGDLQEALEILNATNAELATAQIETETARRNLESAVEAIQEGFAIFDQNDVLILKNRRFSSLLPDVFDDITTGMAFEDYIKTSARSQHIRFPGSLSADEWVRQRLKAHEQASVNFTLQLKDSYWLQISEQRTQARGTIVLQTDITDTMRLHQRERKHMLDQQARIIKETLEHIEQGVIIFDPEGRLAEWNDPIVRILNIPANFLEKGTRLARFAPLFTPDAVFRRDSRADDIFLWLQDRNGHTILRQDIEDRNRRTYEVFGRKMSNGSCLLSFTDITKLRHAYDTVEQQVRERTRELREARDIAERANSSKSRFVAAASHDLLQPVNAAKLFIASLELSHLDTKQASIVSRISRSFQSVEAILGALLDISKLDIGTAVLNISEFPMDPILARLDEEFRPMAQRKGLDLRIIPCALAIRSDPVYLRRILQNLVSNAIRYTASGRVILGAKRRQDKLQICVIDTGAGIPEDQQKLIFQEFHRANTSPTDDTAMGLGLAIVERACDMLDHPLQLSSKVGKGTCFSVTVPLIDQALFEDFADPAGPETPLSMQNAIVMVVENDPGVREGMARMIEAWGGTALTAARRSDAFEQIEALNFVPDVFLIDYHLEAEETGLELIRDLRRTYGPVLAILLTADRDSAIRNEAKKAGVFIRYKPIDLEDLSRLISGMTRRRDN